MVKKKLNELGEICRKLYGSENKRIIREFIDTFTSLNNIVRNPNLTIEENIESYNLKLRKINNEFPKLTHDIWEIYKRNQFCSSFIIDLEPIKLLIQEFDKNNILKNELNEFGKYLKKIDIDSYLAGEYIEQIELIGNATYKKIIGEDTQKGCFILGPKKKNEYYSYYNKSPLRLIQIEKEKKAIEYILKEKNDPNNYTLRRSLIKPNEFRLKNLTEIISEKEIKLPIDIYTFENNITNKKIISHYDLSQLFIPSLKIYGKKNISIYDDEYNTNENLLRNESYKNIKTI